MLLVCKTSSEKLNKYSKKISSDRCLSQCQKVFNPLLKGCYRLGLGEEILSYCSCKIKSYFRQVIGSNSRRMPYISSLPNNMQEIRIPFPIAGMVA